MSSIVSCFNIPKASAHGLTAPANHTLAHYALVDQRQPSGWCVSLDFFAAARSAPVQKRNFKFPDCLAMPDDAPPFSPPSEDSYSLVTEAASIDALFSRLSIITCQLMHVDLASDLGITFVF
jgi:hypothetical protein